MNRVNNNVEKDNFYNFCRTKKRYGNSKKDSENF